METLEESFCQNSRALEKGGVEWRRERVNLGFSKKINK